MARPKKQSPTARRIKAALAKKGLTQIDIARQLGVHPNTVCAAINHDLNEPTRLEIEKLVAA